MSRLLSFSDSDTGGNPLASTLILPRTRVSHPRHLKPIRL